MDWKSFFRASLILNAARLPLTNNPHHTHAGKPLLLSFLAHSLPLLSMPVLFKNHNDTTTYQT